MGSDPAFAAGCLKGGFGANETIAAQSRASAPLCNPLTKA